MRVAVIIAARDLAHLLTDAIRSALAQPGAAVIVVDDGSVDDTAAVIRSLSNPRLFSLTTPGLGVAAARNAGAGHPVARDAEALLFLDGDDWLSPDATVRLTAALRDEPAAAACFAAFAYVAEAAHPGALGRVDSRPARPVSLKRLILGNRFANGGHMLIRQTAFTAAGGFRAELRFAEDWEFWPRLALQGKLLAVPGPPTLFVRRRSGSLMHGAATHLESYQPALRAMAANPDLRSALGMRCLDRVSRQATRELYWTVGRERLRRGMARAALPLLLRGLLGQWRPQRLAVLVQAACLACRSQSG